jgi:hypothetical protein
VSKRKSCAASAFAGVSIFLERRGDLTNNAAEIFSLDPNPTSAEKLGLFLIYFSSMALTNNKRMLFSPPLFLSFLQDKAGEEGKTY